MNKVLLLDKPVGITSFEATEELKRLLRVNKIGHSGTLDKSASGLLVLCTGYATKLTRYFLESDKRYVGKIKLGITTDTCDKEGTIIDKRDTLNIDQKKIKEIENKFKGELLQTPPLYSALKIGGRRASDLIREGKKPELEERKIFIKKLDIIGIDLDNSVLTIEVVCSKGTYIRSLAKDIGIFLNTGAFLESLRRTASGNFTIENSVTIEELNNYLKGKDIQKKFCYSPRDALSDFGSITINKKSTKVVLNGAPFQKDDIIDIKVNGEMPFMILDEGKNLIAIAKVNIDNWIIDYLNVFNHKL